MGVDEAEHRETIETRCRIDSAVPQSLTEHRKPSRNCECDISSTVDMTSIMHCIVVPGGDFLVCCCATRQLRVISPSLTLKYGREVSDFRRQLHPVFLHPHQNQAIFYHPVEYADVGRPNQMTDQSGISGCDFIVTFYATSLSFCFARHYGNTHYP
jgi:hypothetical protein